MGERRITVLSPAWRDIDRIADIHIKLAGPKYAEQIMDKLLESIGSLAAYPYLGPLHPDPVLAQHQYRKLVCGNYVCVYKVIGEDVVIYRVVDGRTDYPKQFL